MTRVRTLTEQPPSGAGQRLRGTDRRAVLIAAATELAKQGIEAVSMDNVAAHAGVSRPLVYKHFANRHELLAAVFRHQDADFERSVAAAVDEATGFEAKTRAMVRALLEAVRTHDAVVVPLLRAGARDKDFLRVQRERDRRVVRLVGALAAKEFALDKRTARAAMGILLSGIDSILTQWRARPTAEQAAFLEEIYVDLTVGGLRQLAANRPAAP